MKGLRKYWHVAQTYLYRPRFWLFGACYLVIACLDSTQIRPQLICVSVLFASIVTGLIGLHLRRQFATPQARLTPDFFVPHFAVALLVSGLVWIAVPWYEAWHMHIPPRVLISAHAVAAVLMAAVVLWPKAILAIPAAPNVVAWLVIPPKSADALAARFIAGEAWAAYWGLGIAAFVGYVLAARRLARLSDVQVATSDDFSLEPPSSAVSRNPVIEMLLKWRDTAIERRLAAVARGKASMTRRRVPSAMSWQELTLLPMLTLALLRLAWYAFGDPAAGWIVLLAGVGLMLFAPLSSWRFRCNALAMEFVRPASRRRFLQETLTAMALDFCAWTAAATVVVAGASVMARGQPGFEDPLLLAAAHIGWIWGLAVLLFGIGLATLRFRAWMPLFILLLLASIGAAVLAVILVDGWFPRSPAAQYLAVGTFAATCAAIGLALTWATYRHWLKMDLS